MAMDAPVETGTPLAPRLLEIATRSAAQAAKASPGTNDELHACLVAILCAHAALEARLNEAGDPLGEWWEDRERQPVEAKWADLVERLTGNRPVRSTLVRRSVARLTKDRNLIAHFRGVPIRGPGLRGRKVRVSGPPDKSRGGITQVRAYFDAKCAGERVLDANEAIEALTPRTRG
jgi:hypothetical protein